MHIEMMFAVSFFLFFFLW